MRIKTITADNMADAIKLIRTSMGPEALILSTRKTKNAKGEPTLEITAAIDEPEPTSKPAAPLSDILAKASQAAQSKPPPTPSQPLPSALPTELAQRINGPMQSLVKEGFSQADALEMLLGKLLTFQTIPDIIGKGKAHVLLGPTGAGKTTLAAKLAIHAKRQNLTVGLMSLDDEKLGGFEPLRIVAETLGDTAHLIRTTPDLRAAAAKLGPRHLIIIDTPGLNPLKRSDIVAFQARLQALGLPTCNHLVLPATHHAEGLNLLPVAFAGFKLASLLATKLDESPHIGGILAAAFTHNIALGLAGLSPNPADAPHPLTPRTVANMLTTPPPQPWEIAS